jgi:glycerol-3-phosphate acyltransferase PlsY
VVAVSYVLGSIATGYYLVRLRTGQDIRLLHSGSTGARNVGRVLGRSGFIVTLSGDLAKGVAAVGLARLIDTSQPAMLKLCALLAVVIGHIWPIQLKCCGGKGIATALGALAVYDPLATAGLMGLFLLIYAIIRRFVPAGLIAMALSPLAPLALRKPAIEIWAMLFLAAIILLAHRDNIRQALALLHQRNNAAPSPPSSSTDSRAT